MRMRMIIPVASVAVLVLASPASVAGAASSGGAAPGQADSAVVIGFELHLTGPDTARGTFIASGAVADFGTSDVQDLVFVPFSPQDRARESGEQTFTGTNGSIITRFSGIARDLSAPRQSATGRFTIVSGTGAYADLRGDGSYTVVVDIAGNHVVGTEVGHVN